MSDLLERPFDVPPDILQAPQANERAWENLQRWPDSYLRIRVGFVDAARGDPAELDKRLRNLVDKWERGEQFGFGIEP